ncbi:MAG TPA: hypothetical protein VMX97_04560, partial [Hyphomicrobiaceae bacterium]|nr:hypothetical protein [Hyphomicrobiaceae bacterium]
MATTYWDDTFTGSALDIDDASYSSDTPGDNYTIQSNGDSVTWGRNGSGVLVAGSAVTNAKLLATGDTAAGTADSRTYLQIATVQSSAQRVGVGLGWLTGGNGYCAICNGSGTYRLYRLDSDAVTELDIADVTIADGDTISISRSGTTIEYYHNGTSVGSYVDDPLTHSGAGFPFIIAGG